MDHDLTVGDVRIRNIQTNIRGWDGTTRRLGNSIFIFEVADLCIAHLGHLHHRLSDEDLRRLGQIDIVFAAIDNSSTLRLDSLMDVLESIGPADGHPDALSFCRGPAVLHGPGRGGGLQRGTGQYLKAGDQPFGPAAQDDGLYHDARRRGLPNAEPLTRCTSDPRPV